MGGDHQIIAVNGDIAHRGRRGGPKVPAPASSSPSSNDTKEAPPSVPANSRPELDRILADDVDRIGATRAGKSAGDLRPGPPRVVSFSERWAALVVEPRGNAASASGPNSVNVVREDPVRRGLLFAGTERGAFVSFDDGEHWQALAHGLPATSVRDITIHGDDVVIATHGRGFYVLDDIVPLRALAANPADASACSRWPPRFGCTSRLHRHADAQGRAARAQPAVRGDDRL